MRALLRSRLRMARREWFGPPGPRGWTRHPALALALAAMLAGFVHGGLSRAFALLPETPEGTAARVGLLALALGGALFAMLAFDVDDAVRSLLLDPDLDLLRRAPVGGARLLAIKVLDTAPRTLPALLALVVPALTAFLAGTPAPGAGVAIAVLAVVALWAATLALGVAVSLLLLRMAPARLAREALTLVSTVTLTLFWIAGALLLPRALEPGSSATSTLTGLLSAAASGANPAAAAARAVAAASGAAGGAARPAIELAYLAACAVLAAAALAGVARAMLGTVLERVAGGHAIATPAPGRARALAPWRGEGVIAAIVRRDARMLGRSASLIADLAIASLLWGLLPLAGLAGGAFTGAEMVRVMLLSLAIGLGYEVAARAIPFERRAGFWVRVAPLSAGRYVAAKLIGASAVSVPIVLAVAGLLAALGAGRGLDPVSTGGLLAGALVLSQSTGLWAGATFGDPEWVNPRAMLRFTGRLVASLLVLAQLAGWFLLRLVLEEDGGMVPRSTGVPALLLVSAALSVVPMRAAARAVSRRGSTD